MWFSQLLLLLLPLVVHPPVSAIEESFCASLRLVHYRTENGKPFTEGDIYSGGPVSMGNYHWYHPLYNSVWAANHARSTYKDATSPGGDEPTLEILPVIGKRADGSKGVLPGWLYLILRRKKFNINQPMPVVAVWALTAKRESIGTFVNVDTRCDIGFTGKPIPYPHDDVDPQRWLPPESVVPCAATPIFSPMNPNMAVFVAQGSSNADNPRDYVYLLWKLDMTVCDNVRTEGFRFMVAITPAAYYESRSIGDALRLDVGKTHGRVIRDATGADFEYAGYGPFVFQTDIIKPKFYGAAAPILDAATLECKDPKSVITKTKPEWLAEAPKPFTNGALKMAEEIFTGVNPTTDKYDDTKNPNLRWRCKPYPTTPPATDCPYTDKKPWPVENLEVIYRRQTCKPRLTQSSPNEKPQEEYKAFYGRCIEEVKEGDPDLNSGSKKRFITPSMTTSPKCPYGMGGGGWTYHYTYIDTSRQGQLKTKGCTCPGIPTGEEVKGAIQRFHIDTATQYDVTAGCRQVKSVKELDKLGLCKDSVAGRNAAYVRLWHASAMLFSVLVSNSVSSYVARYLKGTITVAPINRQYRMPVAKWYVIHIALVLPTLCMYITCLSSMSMQTDILGYSLDSNAVHHRRVGWTIIGAFVFQVVSGFLRPLNMRGRRVAIWIHWGCGEFVYHGAAIVCIMTYKIPASPFSYVRHLDSNFSNIFYHAAPTIMLLWLAWDLLFHGYTTAYIIWFDRKHDVRLGISSYFPIIIPRVGNARYRGRADKDVIRREKNLRRLAWGYAAFCVLTYGMLICVLRFWPNLDHHGFGAMQCTHSQDGHFNLGSTGNTDIIHQKKFCPDF